MTSESWPGLLHWLASTGANRPEGSYQTRVALASKSHARPASDIANLIAELNQPMQLVAESQHTLAAFLAAPVPRPARVVEQD